MLFHKKKTFFFFLSYLLFYVIIFNRLFIYRVRFDRVKDIYDKIIVRKLPRNISLTNTRLHTVSGQTVLVRLYCTQLGIGVYGRFYADIL